ncbi:hypothetical protein Tco_0075450 [Tanacetum coccineum]
MTLSETFQVAAIIEKLPPSWIEFKNYLKHKRKKMSVEDLVVPLRIEEDNKLAQKNTYTPDSAKANMEVDGLRQDRVAVVAKVVPHVATQLVRSDEMGLLVARLAKAALFHGNYLALEEVAALREPFKLEKMPGYRPLSKKEFDQADDNLATASYPFLSKATVDPYSPLEVLLSKKPKSLRVKHAPSRSKPSSLKAS